ncbi:MAG: adenosylcobinamide-GDP ribazoletransferase [Spirochaetia bacterium]|nr:adenosylcobinamide-GDP ribazoletransferase [Spirochaetia bacterium]
MKSFLASVSLLSIIPVPHRWTRNISTCSVYFSLTGFLLGAIFYAAAIAMKTMQMRSEWAAFLILLLMIVITRGFHLDGLSDMADGFWGGKDREHILKIMKDSSTGVFGSLSLILVCLLKWIAIRFIIEQNHLWIFISSAAVSRFSMTLLSGFFNYARKNGTGGVVIQSTSMRHVVIAFLYCLLIMGFFTGYGALYIIFSGAVISMIIGLYSYFKIKGITGDILGASSEISEALLLAITPNLLIFFANTSGGILWQLPIL